MEDTTFGQTHIFGLLIVFSFLAWILRRLVFNNEEHVQASIDTRTLFLIISVTNNYNFCNFFQAELSLVAY